jgi:hypothetical protein
MEKLKWGIEKIIDYISHRYRFGWTVLFFILIIRIFFVGLTTDTTTLLHYSNYILRDGGMYERWFEVNPPLVMLLYIPVVKLIRVGLSPSIALNMYVAFLIILSHVGTKKIISHSTLGNDEKKIWMLAQGTALILLASLFDIYGDREHLFYVFTLPWITAMLFELPISIWIGCLAGIGFCIKPYNMIIFIALYIVGRRSYSWKKMAKDRSWKIVIIVCLMYIFSLFIWFPGYLNTVVPLAMKVYPLVCFDVMHKVFIIALMVLPIPFLMYCIKDSSSRALPVLIAWILSVSLVVFENGGWQYTAYLLLVPLWYGFLISFINKDLLNYSHSKDHRFIAISFLFFIGVIIAALQDKVYDFLNFVPLVALIFPLLSIFNLDRLGLFLSLFTLMIVSGIQLKKNVISTRETGYSINSFRNDPLVIKELQEVAKPTFASLSIDLWAVSITAFSEERRHTFGYDYLWPMLWLNKNPNSPDFFRVRTQLINSFKQSLDQHTAILIVDRSPSQYRLMNDNPHYNSDFIYRFYWDAPELKASLSHYKMIKKIDHCSAFLPSKCRFDIWKLYS